VSGWGPGGGMLAFRPSDDGRISTPGRWLWTGRHVPAMMDGVEGRGLLPTSRLGGCAGEAVESGARGPRRSPRPGFQASRTDRTTTASGRIGRETHGAARGK
jgi:hypothetical protein